jgi:hypothetical protein
MSIEPKYFPVYFAPDQEQSWIKNPGVLSEVRNMVPTVRGTLANYVCSSAENLSAIAPFTAVGTPLNAVVLKRVSNSSGNGARLFVGTNSAILEMGAATFSNVSAHSYTSASRWSFAAYGDIMFACTGYGGQQPTEYPQFSQGVAGTAFANFTTGTPPKAALCIVQQNFLMLFNVYDGVNWYADGWCCSGLGNTGSWATTTANLTTQANNGRLLATPGPITTIANQRDTIVVYKADSMYVMSYTGNPYTWSTRLISDQVGQFMHGGTVVVNGIHYFIHRTGVYRFDGSYPQNIGIGWVNNYISRQLYGINPSVLLGYGSIVGMHDEENNLIIWYFGTAEETAYTTGQANMGLAYNYVNGKWGWIDRSWDELTATTTDTAMCCPVVATRSDLALVGLSTTDSVSPLTVGVLGGNMYLRKILIGGNSTSTNSVSSVITGDIGDEFAFSKLTRIKPNVNVGDDNLQTATCYVDGKPSQGDYYGNEGFVMTGTATNPASGYAIFPLISFSANYRRTLLVSDYVAFDLYAVAGSLLTQIGIKFTHGDATAHDYAIAPTALGSWQSYLLVVNGADVGKTLASVSAMLITNGASGAHQAIVRKMRIVDSTGALRFRLFTGTEIRLLNCVPTTSNYSPATGFGYNSLGTAYTFDTTRRRFDGAVSNRLLRARINLYNRTEISGVYLTTVPAGTE